MGVIPDRSIVAAGVLASLLLLSCGTTDAPEARTAPDLTSPVAAETLPVVDTSMDVPDADGGSVAVEAQGWFSSYTGGTSALTPTPAIPAPVVTHLQSIEHKYILGPGRMARIPGGGVVVSDPKGGAVHILSIRGDYISRIGFTPRPLGVAVDSDQRLLIGDATRNMVAIVSMRGEYVGQFCPDAGAFNQPSDIAIESDTGVVWIADSGNNRIVQCTTAGAFLFAFGSYGVNAGQFNWPVSIFISPTSTDVFVTDSNNGRIQVFNRYGAYVRKIGSQGGTAGKFSRPQGIVVDSKDRLWATDSFQSILQVVSAKTGAFAGWVGAVGEGRGQLLLTGDALIDEYNRLWVTSYRTGRVEIYGIDSYTLPPPPPPPLDAVAVVNPRVVRPGPEGAYIRLFIDVPYESSEIVPESVVIGGLIPLTGRGIVARDVELDGRIYEARVEFERDALVELYQLDGVYEMPVIGQLANGRDFAGIFSVKIPKARALDPSNQGNINGNGGGNGNADGKGGQP